VIGDKRKQLFFLITYHLSPITLKDASPNTRQEAFKDAAANRRAAVAGDCADDVVARLQGDAATAPGLPRDAREVHAFK
jgi:hypothetical protein